MKHIPLPRSLLLPTLVLSTFGAGCDSGTDTVGPPSEVLKIEGDVQVSPVGAILELDVVVRVVDADGDPVPEVEVQFDPSGDGEADPSVTATGPDGRAATTWTLGTTAGTQTLTATVEGGLEAEFTATAEPGVPVVLEKVSGDGQTGPPGTVLPAPLVVRVSDQFENPIPDLTVTFSASGGAVQPQSAVTDVEGRAQTTVQLPEAEGSVEVEADGSGVAPVIFTVFSSESTFATSTGASR